MLRAIVAVAALLLAGVAYYIDDLIKKRKQLDGLVSATHPFPHHMLLRVIHIHEDRMRRSTRYHIWSLVY